MRALSATAALALGALLTPALLALPSAAAPDPGDDPALVAAARVNEMSVTRLERLLDSDPTAELDDAGRLLYRDRLPAARGAAPPRAPAAEFPYDQTFLLHSRPGARRTIYLDFNGHTVSGTAWNQYDGLRARFYAGLSVDGSPAFSDAGAGHRPGGLAAGCRGLRAVRGRRDHPGPGRRPRSPGPAARTRCTACGRWSPRRTGAAPGCLGVAYLDVFDRVDARLLPPRLGVLGRGRQRPDPDRRDHLPRGRPHLGAEHDGEVGGSPYFLGHDMWSPIMGAGYGALTQFSKGEYANAEQHPGRPRRHGRLGHPLRNDDHGGGAEPLAGSTAGVDRAPLPTPTCSRSRQPAPGQLTVSATPVERGPEPRHRTDGDQPPRGRHRADPESGSSSTFVPTGLDATYSACVPAGTYLVQRRRGRRSRHAHDRVLRLRQPRRLLDQRQVALPGAGRSGRTVVGDDDSDQHVGEPALAAAILRRRLRCHRVRRRAGRQCRRARAGRPQPHVHRPGAGHDVHRVRAGPHRRGDSPSVSRSVRTAATRPGAARIGTAESGSRGGAVTAKARWSAPTSTGGVDDHRLQGARPAAQLLRGRPYRRGRSTPAGMPDGW